MKPLNTILVKQNDFIVKNQIKNRTLKVKQI